ncbi:MAG: hypothetical protein U0J50_09055 [Peptacetobacter hiranonis]|nr:hypothetical protein [Peptacetobacter hiranonis]
MKFAGNKIITLALALTMFLSSVDMRIFAFELNENTDKAESYRSEENSSQDISTEEVDNEKQEDKQNPKEENKENLENDKHEESKDKEKEESKNDNEKPNEENDVVAWPDKPEWLDNMKPNLDDIEIEEKIYGVPEKEMKKIELINLQNLSMQEEADLNKKIPDNQIEKNIKVFINGEEYKGGNITISLGDSFTYLFAWHPKDNIGII